MRLESDPRRAPPSGPGDLTLAYTDAERALIATLDFSRLPRHVACIMDGNGRWAKKLGRERIFGHQTARRTVRTTVETCRDLGIDFLTLFCFSSENWSRPAAEVSFLMRLLGQTLVDEKDELDKNGVTLRLMGEREPLPTAVRLQLESCVEALAENKHLVLSLAINYGGRQDILGATRRLAARVKAGELEPDQITDEVFSSHLATAGVPDPELLIRTAGEYRVSNFLLWQMAYSELWITPVLWPDFARMDLLTALKGYQQRERRFGGVSV